MKAKADSNRPKQDSNKTSRKELKQSIASAEVLPDDSLLEAVDGSNTQLRTCYHHSVFLTLYCDTCEEPVCDQCTIVGPHNTQMHKIGNMMDAYNSRVAKLSHIINGNLIKKRDELVSRINGIEVRIEELKHRQEKIERDIRTECGYIMERLKNAEGSKQAVLNHEMHVVQEELEHMQEIKRRFLELTKEEATVPQFLAASTSLNKNIEFLLSKPVKKNPEIYPWDLPYELKDTREALDNNKVLVSASKFKQEAIWLLWEQKIKAEKEATAEYSQVTQDGPEGQLGDEGVEAHDQQVLRRAQQVPDGLLLLRRPDGRKNCQREVQDQLFEEPQHVQVYAPLTQSKASPTRSPRTSSSATRDTSSQSASPTSSATKTSSQSSRR